MAHAAETPETGEQRGQLISREVNNAVHAAFNALAQTVLVNDSRTLEDLLREMLQPILKVWLNDNLPGMVERLVRVEIERISPPRRVASPTSHFTDRPASSF
jgi:cell pole-organizing protein PopZ